VDYSDPDPDHDRDPDRDRNPDRDRDRNPDPDPDPDHDPDPDRDRDPDPDHDHAQLLYFDLNTTGYSKRLNRLSSDVPSGWKFLGVFILTRSEWACFINNVSVF
jgi:hypothetical protein